MILIYRVLTSILFPFIILLIYLRKFLKKEDSVRFKEKIFSSFFNVRRKEGTRLIWFHGASIGEFKSVLPIINELSKENKNLEFLITTITVSSGNLAKEELKKFSNVYHRFLPVDVKFVLKRFLASWQPEVIFLIDSEIWPNLILLAKKNKIPLALINARITKKSFRKWIAFKNSAKIIFKSFDVCLSSNIETTKYLKELDAKKIIYTGNLKLANKIKFEKISNIYDKILKNNFFWIAASTHHTEEDFCLKTHTFLKKKFNKFKTILAPRHIERVPQIKKLCEKLGLNYQILGKNEPLSESKEVIIINSYGVLPIFLKHSKCVFLGKSLIEKLKDDSGQSPIEAAQLGCKIYHGPYVYNFEEIYEILKANKISFEIKNYKELLENLEKDFMNFSEKKLNTSVLMDNLGKKTLEETMKGIKFILKHDN